MNIYCKQCGEPWSIYYLKHEARNGTYKRVLKGEGCNACNWGEDAPDEDHTEEYLQGMNNIDEDPLKYI